ncbi:MAG TPA: class I SAM-dependent methyltransferase [Alphaproteobacteria bacterium]
MSSDLLMTPQVSVQVSRKSRAGTAVMDSLADAKSGLTKIPDKLFQLAGMSGRRYRIFINQLIGRLADARYLEVGCWAGSTLCSAIFGNDGITALAIDNFTQFGGPAAQFFVHLGMAHPKDARISFLNQDYRNVDLRLFGPFNVYLFDGPHEYQDHADAIAWAAPHLDDDAVLIVDDWNWERVRAGTLDALKATGLRIDTRIEIRTTLDESYPAIDQQHSDWHNGYAVFVLGR